MWSHGSPGSLLGACCVPTGCLQMLPRCFQSSGPSVLISQQENRTKSTKYMFQKSRVCFIEVAEAPQVAARQTHRAGRPLEHDGTLQIYSNLENHTFLKKWNLTGKNQIK